MADIRHLWRACFIISRPAAESGPFSLPAPMVADVAAEMRQEIERLREEVASLRGVTIMATKTMQVEPSQPATVSANQGSPSDEHDDPLAEDDLGTYWYRLNEKLFEITEAPWTTARTLTERITGVLPLDSSIHSADCRGQLCRMEIIHRSPEAVQAMYDAWRARRGPDSIWEGPLVSRVVSEPDDVELVVEMYLAHDELPE